MRPSSSIRFTVVAFVFALGGCSPSPPAPPTVSAVIDGDTIVIDFGSHDETVRLLGLDTPESVDPNRPVQCFGVEATERLRALLPTGTRVRLEIDLEARDRYGRLLAYVFVGDLMVNEALLAEGYGALSLYEPNSTYRRRLVAAERKARTQLTGLWSACDGPDEPVDPPWPVAA
jgi:micrococcal nuclease